MTITKMHIPKRINNPQEIIEPIGLIIHNIGNPNTSALANAKYFTNVADKISVHYIVDDTQIIEIIPPNFKTYGTSNGSYNNRYIQIEFCHPKSDGVMTDKTKANLLWLCNKLINDYGIDRKRIIRHFDVTKKLCPAYYIDEKRWSGLVDEMYQKKTEPHWAQVHYDNLVKKGVKISETRFDDNVTRGELFALLDRVLK